MNPQCLLCRSFCKRSYPRPCLLMAAACNDPSVWIISDQMKTSISIIIIKVCLYFCSVGSFSSLNLWLQQETRSWWFHIKHCWICVAHVCLSICVFRHLNASVTRAASNLSCNVAPHRVTPRHFRASRGAWRSSLVRGNRSSTGQTRLAPTVGIIFCILIKRTFKVILRRIYVLLLTYNDALIGKVRFLTIAGLESRSSGSQTNREMYWHINARKMDTNPHAS